MTGRCGRLHVGALVSRHLTGERVGADRACQLIQVRRGADTRNLTLGGSQPRFKVHPLSG